MALVQIVHFVFYFYTILLIINVCLSWFPNVYDHAIARFIRSLTDPYLALFRRFIPPLGPLDLSPIAAFFALRIMEVCVRRILLS